MKRDRHGKGKILSQQEIQLLFSQGLTNLRDRCLFAIMMFTACRVNEACTLLSEDVYDSQGRVRSHLTIRKKNTKRKLATRTLPIIQELRTILAAYEKQAGLVYLFPGRRGGHITNDSAMRILRKACERVGIEGASTHSFRRTALTQMSDNNTPLRVIAEVSGHRNLSQLQAYLDVRPEQVLGAVSSLSMLSPVLSDFPEGGKLTMGYLLEAYIREKGIRFYGRGGFTLEAPGYASGTPDESYCIGSNKETPDIVIEIIVTSGTINRRELYKPKRIPEVWFWKSEQMRIFRLNEAGEYEEVSRSGFFPDLDKTLLLRYIAHPDQYDAVNEFVAFLRSQQ